MTNLTGWEIIIPFLKPLEPFILDPSVTEIMVNNHAVFIERSGLLERVAGAEIPEKGLIIAIKNIARRLGCDVSEDSPILDSRLPSGDRVNAVLPPASILGPTLSIRKFSHPFITIEKLVEVGMLTQELAAVLVGEVRERRNILMSGSTSSGKTTLLNALAKTFDPNERVLIIEDTAEISLEHENLVRFEARRPQNGSGGVTVRDLVRAAMRNRPDRLVLGEIRDAAAFELLIVLNSGHAGSLSTCHGSSAAKALDKFATLVLQAGMDMPHKAIKSAIADCIDLVVHLERCHGVRQVREVVRVCGYAADVERYNLESLCSLQKEGGGKNGERDN